MFHPTKKRSPCAGFPGAGAFVWYRGSAVKRAASLTFIMGIFLLTGFPKVFYYSHSKNFLPTLLISNWDNVVRPIVAVQCRLYILKDLAMSYRYSYSIPTCVYFHSAMYNNVLLSYRSFLLTVSSIVSCISNCTIIGFVPRLCKNDGPAGISAFTFGNRLLGHIGGTSLPVPSYMSGLSFLF